MVIWAIGISSSGKTTVSKLVYERLKPILPNLVRLDGDIIREVFDNDADYSIEGRRKNAKRLSRLSKFLSDEGLHVITAVLSIFPEWQTWNRKNIPGYAEVYLKVSVETAARRDKNNLYLPALEGKVKNVVGVDIPFPEPANCDLIIDNNQDRDDFDELVQKVMSLDVIQNVITAKR